MAVIFWAVGGVVASAVLHDDHSDYDNYDNYGNYSNYSDSAERQRKRLAALQSDTESAARELSGYKRGTVNPELTSQYLISRPAMRVNESDMNDDAKAKIQRKITCDETSETSNLQSELSLVDDILNKISRIEKENQA